MTKNLYLLQEELSKANLQGFIISSKDEFLSEYSAPYYRRLEWISNFTGSNGLTLIKSKGKSAFFTDGRYTLQASLEVDKEEFDILDYNNKTIVSWIENQFCEGDSIGYDARTFTENELIDLEKKLETKYKLVSYDYSFIDQLWKDRPSKSSKLAFIYSESFCGISYKDKIHQVREKMNSNSDILIITLSESICWLLNLRGHDLEDSPILHSYAIVSRDKVTVFTDLNKITSEIIEHRPEIDFCHFSELKNSLLSLQGQNFQLDPDSNQKWFFDILKDQVIIKEIDPCIILKSIKNQTEIESMKKAHIFDGVALVKFLYWLDNNIGKLDLDELLIGKKLLEYRKENKEFFCSSFATIAGFGANGAIIHYKATPQTNAKIGNDNFLLLDSGAQYYSGTTDITRTIVIGNVSFEQRKNYTLVLKSHIMLGSAKFPSGTTGTHLDSLARYPLWQEYKDYKHGPGHGVGCFLGVHEGPARISKAFNYHRLQAGMIFSNEPGFYQQDQYGIRIENLVAVKDCSNNFMEFENLTMVPIATKPIILELMTNFEIEWINNYHAQVFEKISPYITDQEVLKWLTNSCKPL